MAKTKQIKQIITFLSAYPKDIAELGIEAWRTGEMPLKTPEHNRQFIFCLFINSVFIVIPAKAGIQNTLKILDSRFHGNDGKRAQRQFMDKYYLI